RRRGVRAPCTKLRRRTRRRSGPRRRSPSRAVTEGGIVVVFMHAFLACSWLGAALQKSDLVHKSPRLWNLRLAGVKKLGAIRARRPPSPSRGRPTAPGAPPLPDNPRTP